MDIIKYGIFYKGRLAAKCTEMGFPLTAFRARQMKRRLMQQKGWREYDVEIKPLPTEEQHGQAKHN